MSLLLSLRAWLKRRAERRHIEWLRRNKVILPRGKTLWERTRELENRS